MQRAKATQGVNVESVAPGEKKALTSFRAASVGLAKNPSPAALADRSGNLWMRGVPSRPTSARLSARSGDWKSSRISYNDSVVWGEETSSETTDDESSADDGK